MSSQILSAIKSPQDLRSLDKAQIDLLCEEIREKIIDVVSENGGHLASNLGTVELTMAVHRIFNSPEDKIIFDVGHQSYTHKLITGRYESFDTIRLENGLSGFTRPDESEHDVFVSGHSSTSISAGLGLACANKLNGKKDYVVSIIGDGALTGGLCYEAMNNTYKRKNTNFIVILNDNKMSISRNVGAMPRHLAVIRSSPVYYDFKTGVERVLLKIPFIGKPLRNAVLHIKTSFKNLLYNSNIFESMGFSYLGPIDGHDIQVIESSLKIAKQMKGPVLIHAITTKGKGYKYAEKNPTKYHGVSNFEVQTGEQSPVKQNFSLVCGQTLCKLAETNEKICVVDAAMTSGTGLDGFAEQYPKRFFDVGIAEAHAVTFCSGLAKGGLIPFFAVYSSFLQRGYDELIHDLAIQKLKAIMLIDRAGFVGMDGETHQGLLDVAYITSIPNTEMYAPCYHYELEECIKKAAASDENKLIAIRYPRGSELARPLENIKRGSDASWFVTGDHQKTLIITYGRIFANALMASYKLNTEGTKCDILKLTKIWPIESEVVQKASQYDKIFFFEEANVSCGIGEHFLHKLSQFGFKGSYSIFGVTDCFVGAVSTEHCFERFGLSEDKIYETVKNG